MSTKAERKIKLTRGVPPEEALPCDLVQDCCARALAEHGEVLLQYHPATGFGPLRELLAAEAGAPPEALLVGNGSIQLLFFLAQGWLSPGDVVAVERPTYDRAVTAFRTLGLHVVGVRMEDDGPELACLEEVVRRHSPRLFYTVPDFQNPTGVTTSAAKREAIAGLAAETGMLIVEDIPYRRLRYWGQDVPTYRELLAGQVVQLSSFSKLLAPGLRVGWALAQPELTATMAKLAEDAYITPGMLAQGVVYQFLRGGYLADNLAALKRLYRPRLAAMLTALEEHLPDGRWVEPEGGFFVGLTLPAGVDAAAVAAVARREEGLVLSDSAGFFADGDSSWFVRLPFCALNEEEIDEAVARLARAAATVRSRRR
ncbi:MAG: PLP-dependent aminotransferase family protein [Candidatus Bipolaricaulaceae bacterium]